MIVSFVQVVVTANPRSVIFDDWTNSHAIMLARDAVIFSGALTDVDR
jgi:hypothetical protein